MNQQHHHTSKNLPFDVSQIPLGRNEELIIEESHGRTRIYKQPHEEHPHGFGSLLFVMFAMIGVGAIAWFIGRALHLW